MDSNENIPLVFSEITEEWLDCYQKQVDEKEDLSKSIFWRLAVKAGPPLGVDENDPRVIEALKHIRQQMEQS